MGFIFLSFPFTNAKQKRQMTVASPFAILRFLVSSLLRPPARDRGNRFQHATSGDVSIFQHAPLGERRLAGGTLSADAKKTNHKYTMMPLRSPPWDRWQFVLWLQPEIRPWTSRGSWPSRVHWRTSSYTNETQWRQRRVAARCNDCWGSLSNIVANSFTWNGILGSLYKFD